jgi:hypothetical protein
MWQSCALVFISSACVLVIELIAGRIMAPYVGVSLYTWTSIIGIVLAGMSVGNYLGGAWPTATPRPAHSASSAGHADRTRAPALAKWSPATTASRLSRLSKPAVRHTP